MRLRSNRTFLLTDVKHAVQLYVVRPGHGRRGRQLVVDEQRERGGRYLQQVHRVPVVVAVDGPGRVPEPDRVRARPDVDQHVAVDQLGEREVVVLAAVVEEQPGRVPGLEPEVHVHPGVGLQRGQSDERVFRQERDRVHQRRRFLRLLVFGRRVHFGQVFRVCETENVVR